MSKIVLIVGIAIIFSIVIVFTGFFFLSNNNQNIFSKDVFCDSFTNEQNKITCITAQAIYNKDSSFCNSISSEFDRNFCSGQVIFNKALSNNDPSICRETMYYESCITFYAKRKKDSSVCDMVTNKDYCFYSVALEKESSSICNKIIDEKEKKSCINKVLKKDVSECADYGVGGSASYIIDVSCIREISSSLTLTKCEEIANTIEYKRYSDMFKDFCIGGIAYRDKDKSICNQISDSSNKQTCLSGVDLKIKESALNSKNLEMCNQISESVEKEDCINEIKILNNYDLTTMDFSDTIFEN